MVYPIGNYGYWFVNEQIGAPGEHMRCQPGRSGGIGRSAVERSENERIGPQRGRTVNR